MVVVLKQTGNNVTGTLSGSGTVDGPIEGTVRGNTIQLSERGGFRGTPLLKVSCEQISGPLSDGAPSPFAAFRNRQQSTGSKAARAGPAPRAVPAGELVRVVALG
jgi:hypothetical protein